MKTLQRTSIKGNMSQQSKLRPAKVIIVSLSLKLLKKTRCMFSRWLLRLETVTAVLQQTLTVHLEKKPLFFCFFYALAHSEHFPSAYHNFSDVFQTARQLLVAIHVSSIITCKDLAESWNVPMVFKFNWIAILKNTIIIAETLFFFDIAEKI